MPLYLLLLQQVAPPFRVVEFDVLFGSGIDKYGCLLDAAERFEVIQRRGSWYSRGDLRFAQGRRPAAEYLRSDPVLSSDVEREVRTKMAEKLSIGFEDAVSTDDDDFATNNEEINID